MRLDHLTNPPTGLSPEGEQVLEMVQARRGAHGLYPLDLTLLYSPNFTRGWHAFFGAIRGQGILPHLIREITIIRAALLNQCWMEWYAYAEILMKRPDFNAEKLVVLQQIEPEEQGALSEREWAVLRYADTITKTVIVPQEIFDAVLAVGFSQQEIVEITLTCAAYNAVARVAVPLDIGEFNDKISDFTRK